MATETAIQDIVPQALLLSGRRRWSVYLYTLKGRKVVVQVFVMVGLTCMEVGLVLAGHTV